MSEFTVMLEELIKEKEIQISELVRYCGFDRKEFFKLLQGKGKLPEEETVHRMTLFMKLTPFEQREFHEAYQMSVLGKNRYFMRKQVQDLIEHFPECFQPASESNITEIIPDRSENQGKECIPLSSQTEVNQWVHRICLQEAKEGKDSRICMFMQADYRFIFDLLQSLKKFNENLEIEHVTFVDVSDDIPEETEFYNLGYLKNILPLYISGMNYRLYSIKENLQACKEGIEGFSSLILTSEHVLLCTADFGRGMVYHSQEILDYFRNRYQEYRNRGELRFHIIDDIRHQISTLGDMGWDKRVSYALQPEPCLLSFLTPEIMEAAVWSQLPGRAEMLQIAGRFIENARIRVEKGINHFYCTKEALDRFAMDGCLPEVPSEIYRPLLTEERIKLIKEAIPLCQKGVFRFMKPPLDHLAANLHLCINEKEGYLLFRNMSGKNVYLIMHDRKLLLAFWDFLSSMDDRLLYTEKETEDYFIKVLRRLEEKL